MVPSSRLLIWVAAACLPAALLLVAAPAAGAPVALLWSAFAAVAVADAALAPRRLRKITVVLPTLVRLTHDLAGELEMRIAGVGGALDLRIAPVLPVDLEAVSPVAEVHLTRASPSGASGDDSRGVAPAARATISCTPRRRGLFRIEACRIECSSPFGFWRARREVAVDCEVRAYPNLLSERRHVPALFLYRGRAGAHRQQQVGKGREFERLRDYLPGDSYEDVDWKATARRGKPVTKLFQVERTQEVYVLVDASRLSARPSGGADETPVPALERMIRAALVLAVAAERQGDLFGLVTFGDRVHSFLRARAGASHFQACREALFALSPQSSSPDFVELASFLRSRLRRRALLVVLTDLDDPLLAESFERAAELLRRQHLLLVCALRPADVAPIFSRPVQNSGDLYRELAGHLRWQDQRDLGRALERRGVSYAALPAETLSAEVVSRYAAIKQRQLL
ncbi:MAG: DUF58 domain-containing protein [Thermoanaerobaculia bacterium]